MFLKDVYAEIENPILLGPRSLTIVSGVPSNVRRVWRNRRVAAFAPPLEDADAGSRHRASWRETLQFATMNALGQIGCDLSLAGRIAADRILEHDEFVHEDRRRDGLTLLGGEDDAGVIHVYLKPNTLGFVGKLRGGVFLDFGRLQHECLERYTAIREDVLEELRAGDWPAEGIA